MDGSEAHIRRADECRQSLSPKTSGEDITDWTQLAQDTILCRNSMNTAIKLCVLRMSHIKDGPVCLQLEEVFLSLK
jgi:hypothetical protein